jgi:hypothetical protein
MRCQVSGCRPVAVVRSSNVILSGVNGNVIMPGGNDIWMNGNKMLKRPSAMASGESELGVNGLRCYSLGGTSALVTSTGFAVIAITT